MDFYLIFIFNLRIWYFKHLSQPRISKIFLWDFLSKKDILKSKEDILKVYDSENEIELF